MWIMVYSSSLDCAGNDRFMNSMQGWTTTTRHGVRRKEAQKRIQDRENLFKKNLLLKDVY